jgi:lipopolysaccharide assembly outer membrane protein LptD (OstA)
MFVKFGITRITSALALAIAMICGAGNASANDQPIAFEADNVVVNQADASLLATGNVMLEQAGSTLRADEVTYYQNEDRAVARGNVIHKDREGTVNRAHVMELETEFTHIVAETLISQFASGDWMAASHADRNAGRQISF